MIAHTAGDLFAGNIPITGVAGDQQAALFGQCCFTPGMVKNTYGTGCFMLMNTGNQARVSRNRLLTTAAWSRDRTSYALEGGVFVGGAVVQWLRDGLGMIRTSSEIEPLAASVADSDGVYFVPAFTGLGAPHWDPYARGTLIGLTRGTTRAHVARAALAAMRADAGIAVTELRVDGGAAANALLMQFQADLLGVPVVRPRQLESTAQGAAYLAGLAVGYWQDEAEIGALWKVDRIFEPSMEEGRRAAFLDGWAKALGRAKDWEEGP
jgi:glycerol kinase